MAVSEAEWAIRQRAFEFLDALRAQYGDVLPRSRLTSGFGWEGARVPLMGPQGIFKPRVLPQIALSITTAPPSPNKPRPYDDELGDGGVIKYRYRGTDPNHHENVGLRMAWKRQVPLVYFYGIVPGSYVAEYPVFVVGDEPARLTFMVQVDQRSIEPITQGAVAEHLEPRREYITVAAKKRLHQRAFRERVIRAYRRCCAMCRLKHVELLDAAHILPDSDEGGRPVVSNGLALCKLHHAAFDRDIVGVRPDLVVEVQSSVLRETDGPMLVHGLQGLHGQRLLQPRRKADRPSTEFIERRYEQFRDAG